MKNSINPARIFVFLTLLCLTGLGTGTAMAARGDLSISNFQGDVQVKAVGAADWTVAKFDQILAEGDSIKTGADAIVVLKMDKVGTLTLDSETEVTVQKKSIQGKIIDAELNIKLGTLKGDLQKLHEGSSFKLISPTAVAAVRGTSFIIRVRINGTTLVFVQTGEMNVQAISTGNVQLVGAGAAINVSTAGFVAVDPSSPEYAEIARAFQQVIARALGIPARYVSVQQVQAKEDPTADLEPPINQKDASGPT